MENLSQENATQNVAQQEDNSSNEAQQEFEPIDREKFLELSKEDQNEYKNQRYKNLDDIEKQAMEQGWSPEELLNHQDKEGNPKKGISAQEFVNKGEQIKEIAIANYKKTNGELEAKLENFAEQNKILQDQIKQILDNQDIQSQSQKESKLQKLQNDLAQAKEDLEVDKALDLQQEIFELKNSLKKEEKPLPKENLEKEEPLSRENYPESVKKLWNKHPILDPFSNEANKALIFDAEKIAEKKINQGKHLNDSTIKEIEEELKEKHSSFFPKEKKQNINVLNNPQSGFIKPNSYIKATKENLTESEKKNYKFTLSAYKKVGKIKNPENTALQVINFQREVNFNKKNK